MADEALAFGGNKLPDEDRRQARAGERLARFSFAVGGDERRHPEAAIEGTQHLLFVEIAGRREPGKDGLRHEGVEIKRDGETVIEHARQIVWIAAASDMGERVYASRSLQRLKQRAHIKPRRRQQRGGERKLWIERGGSVPSEPAPRDDAPHQ